MVQKFEKSYRIHVYETSPNSKLNLHSLFNYMQDIASDHAEVLGYGRNDLLKHNNFWVLSRLYTEIISWPEWEEDILVKTWPNGTDKLFALRNYELFNAEGKALAHASSSWLILDRETRKIQRPEGSLEGRDMRRQEAFAIRNATKLETAVRQGTSDYCFRIKTSDLDINFHTNNAVYLKWISDSYDLGFLMKNDPQSVEINYLAESRHDEELAVRTSAENEFCFNHSICRTNDGKEFCRVRVVWKPSIDNK